MAESCPISFEQIDERVARINGTLTVLSMAVFLLTPFKAIVLILGADLFIRGFLKPSSSFYSFFSRKILQVLNVTPVMVNAGPKIFAAKIGFIFCCIIFLFHFLSMPTVCFIFGSMLLFFAFLEAAFGFCVACQLHPYMPNALK
jgi:hypothetical protein